jgi:hypothetical protein
MSGTNTVTTLQSLIPLNGTTIDEEKFVESDRVAACRRYKNVFMQNCVGEDIFDAIASKSGSKAVGRNEASTVYYIHIRMIITPIRFD